MRKTNTKTKPPIRLVTSEGQIAPMKAADLSECLKEISAARRDLSIAQTHADERRKRRDFYMQKADQHRAQAQTVDDPIDWAAQTVAAKEAEKEAASAERLAQGHDAEIAEAQRKIKIARDQIMQIRSRVDGERITLERVQELLRKIVALRPTDGKAIVVQLLAYKGHGARKASDLDPACYASVALFAHRQIMRLSRESK